MPAATRLPIVLAAALAAASAVLVFGLIGRVELTFDEAYYTLWSRYLTWGYYDHPPMVAVWIRASTALFGGSEFGVRALGAAAFALVPGLVGVMAARLYDSPRVGAYAALVWLGMPLSAGAALVTPDAPLTFFSALTLMGLIEVYRGCGLGWLIVGAALGLALQSKFTALFLGAGVGLALFWVPSLRKELRNPAPYAAAGLSVAIFAPFLVWNSAHGWATFVKQFGRVPGRGVAVGYVAEFLAAQFALANPLLMIAGISIFRRMSPPEDERRRLLLAFLSPAIGYFLVHSLHDRVQGNWTAPLYPALAIVAGEAAARGPGWARRLGSFGIPLGLTVIAFGYLHIATDWPALGPEDPLARIGGWRELARQVDVEAKRENAAFILARGYAATSLLTYYGDGVTPVIQSGEPERWIFAPAPDSSWLTRPGLAIGEADRGEESDLKGKFRVVERVGVLTRRQRGTDVGAFELFRVAEPIGDSLIFAPTPKLR
jgi:4-amino-4-deoxy-L-arabinose transferase-like glycosyltransferase